MALKNVNYIKGLYYNTLQWLVIFSFMPRIQKYDYKMVCD
jgi:hypothetical protein